MNILKLLTQFFFTIKKGETPGLAGESGCGKSTIAKLIVNLEHPTEGKIEVLGDDISKIRVKKKKDLRK